MMVHALNPSTREAKCRWNSVSPRQPGLQSFRTARLHKEILSFKKKKKKKKKEGKENCTLNFERHEDSASRSLLGWKERRIFWDRCHNLELSILQSKNSKVPFRQSLSTQSSSTITAAY